MANSVESCSTGLTVWIFICQPRPHAQFYQMSANSSYLLCRQLSMMVESVSPFLPGSVGKFSSNWNNLNFRCPHNSDFIVSRNATMKGWDERKRTGMRSGREGKLSVFSSCLLSTQHRPIPDGAPFLVKYAGPLKYTYPTSFRTYFTVDCVQSVFGWEMKDYGVWGEGDWHSLARLSQFVLPFSM